MVNFPPTLPVGSVTGTIKNSSTRRTTPSNATQKREMQYSDRRRMQDRRGRRGAKQVMDRRSGPERRRTSIDLSV